MRCVIAAACIVLLLGIAFVGLVSLNTEIVLWMRADLPQPTRYFVPTGTTWKVTNGWIGFEKVHEIPGWPAPPGGTFNCGIFNWRRTIVANLGAANNSPASIYQSAVAVPFVLPMLFCAVPLFIIFRDPYRRYRREKKGLCLNCGYDRRGNVSGVCPECGARV